MGVTEIMRKTHLFRLAIAVVALIFLAACSGTTTPSQITDDVSDGDPDVGYTDDAGDAGTGQDDVDDDPDAHTDPDSGNGDNHNPGAESETVAPAILSGVGSDGFLLRGTVLTPDGILDPGEVLVESDIITCVAVDCSTEAASGDFTVIETLGVISPGLIDAHNHLPYNFLPPWIPPNNTLFANRYQWMNEVSYRSHIAPYGDNRSRGSHYCPAAKWGELRSMTHATTTIQGQSFQQLCVNWGVRNADHYHGLGHNHMRTMIGSPRDITDDQAQNYIDSFLAENNPTTRFAVHMAEGYAENNVELEFDSFAGRDPRPNRHAGQSLLEYGTALLIHSMILTPVQIDEILMTGSMVVWSPSSNIALYGQTAPIQMLLEHGVVTGLGPDWTVSGAFDMLQEMRVAHQYGEENQIQVLTPQRIWEMSTIDGAIAVGLEEDIGRLEPGFQADIAIFGRNGEDPYRAVVDSRSTDVELVMVAGSVYYGDAHLEAAARNQYCDEFEACSREKFLCAQDSPTAANRRDETVGDIRQQLIDILDGLDDAPADQQYGRGDELLELVICGI